MELDYLRRILDYDRETGVFTWRVVKSAKVKIGDVAGKPQLSVHIQIKIDGKYYLAHRLAWFIEHGNFPESSLDHVDRNPRNNAILNLRVASKSQNGMNRDAQRNSKSRISGVHFERKIGVWVARITIDGKQKHLGRFGSIFDAACARRSAEIDFFGEFRRL